jgi:mono/diheme cytochrome c family protein
MRTSMAVLALLLAALALGVAACGGEEDQTATPETVEGTLPEPETGDGDAEDLPALALTGDPAAGASVYEAGGCGGCHTLAAAGSSGTVGPNLDDSQPTYELAVERITKGQGAMPAFGDSLSAQEIADVSQYVSESAGG